MDVCRQLILVVIFAFFYGIPAFGQSCEGAVEISDEIVNSCNFFFCPLQDDISDMFATSEEQIKSIVDQRSGCGDGCQVQPKVLVNYFPVEHKTKYAASDMQLCQERLQETKESPISPPAREFTASGPDCFKKASEQAMEWFSKAMASRGSAGDYLLDRCPDPCSYYSQLQLERFGSDSSCRVRGQMKVICGHPRTRKGSKGNLFQVQYQANWACSN